jgi:hypothetical protein
MKKVLLSMAVLAVSVIPAVAGAPGTALADIQCDSVAKVWINANNAVASYGGYACSKLGDFRTPMNGEGHTLRYQRKWHWDTNNPPGYWSDWVQIAQANVYDCEYQWVCTAYPQSGPVLGDLNSGCYEWRSRGWGSYQDRNGNWHNLDPTNDYTPPTSVHGGNCPCGCLVPERRAPRVKARLEE